MRSVWPRPRPRAIWPWIGPSTLTNQWHASRWPLRRSGREAWRGSEGCWLREGLSFGARSCHCGAMSAWGRRGGAGRPPPLCVCTVIVPGPCIVQRCPKTKKKRLLRDCVNGDRNGRPPFFLTKTWGVD